MKKKVLIFVPSLSGGGAERTIVNIIRHINKEQFEVTLVMLKEVSNQLHKNEYLSLVENNANLIYLKSRKSTLALPKIIKQLASCIRQQQPDIVFSTMYKVNVTTILAKKLSRTSAKLVIRESNNRTAQGIKGVQKLLTSYFYKQADRVIALSEGVQQDLIQNFGIDKNQVTVIYNPIDIPFINELLEEEIHEIDIEELTTKKVIVAIGRLSEQKDYPTLLHAFKQIKTEVGATLLILGKGPLEAELKQLTAELRLEQDVFFLGFQRNPYKFLKAADLFILSSRWEGFGHVIVEAMVSGTPVVSTNCPSGPSEIIEHGTNGDLVPVGDGEQIGKAAISLLTSQQKSSKYRKEGIKRAHQFSAKKIVQEYEKSFNV